MSEMTLSPLDSSHRWRFDYLLPALFRPRQAFARIAEAETDLWQTPIAILTLTALIRALVAGERGSLPLQVVNVGTKSVMLGNFSVAAGGAMIENGRTFVGNLELGRFFPLEAMMKPSYRASMASIGCCRSVLAVSTPVWLPVFALSFATLVGLLSSLYPALSAATLSPIKALKYE